jgi:hypothetical protein
VEEIIKELEFHSDSRLGFHSPVPFNMWLVNATIPMLEEIKFKLKIALEADDARELHNDHGR